MLIFCIAFKHMSVGLVPVPGMFSVCCFLWQVVDDTMMLCIQSCWFGQTGIFLVFWKILRSSWRCEGVETEAGRMLLVCSSLIPRSRLLSKKPVK